jgi:P27 family predicted phage terminase small subunit
MAGPRQPIELVIAKDKKHLTKAEIEERRQRELQPCTDEIAAPSYLTAKQKKEFNKIAAQLVKLKIMGETDCDTLARYVIAQEHYVQAVKDLRAAQKQRPKCDDVAAMVKWAALLEQLDKRVERYAKQAQTAAAALGLTISSRCRLVAPVIEEKPKENKFSKFGKAAGGH